jgi:hypothetical protein
VGNFDDFFVHAQMIILSIFYISQTCRVGTSFSLRVNISKGRVWLRDKKTYASVETADSFGGKFYIECLKQGVENAGKVYFEAMGRYG